MPDAVSNRNPLLPEWFQRRQSLFITLGVLLLVAAVRIRLLDFPLERDEGEYAYAGQLILQGIPPYKLVYNMKFPGTYAAYAAIMAVFGETPAGIHLGLTCVTTLTALMLYWLGRRLIDDVAGSVAAMSFAILAATPSMAGLAGHATHFAALFGTAGLCLLWSARQTTNLLKLAASGVMFGMALMMKQQAVFLGLFGLATVGVACFRQTQASWPGRIKSIAAYSLGVFAPFGLTCLILWQQGVFEQFWFWTISYAREYVSQIPLHFAPTTFWSGISGAASRCAPLWGIAAAGLVIIWFDPRTKATRSGLTAFLLASLLTTCPGFYFRSHYFLLMLPAISLLAGCAISGARHIARMKSIPRMIGALPTWGYALVLAVSLFENWDVWFSLGPLDAARTVYGGNPFPEAQTVAGYIRTNTVAGDRIAVLGSEPEIYFLSGRHSATGYIYTYPLMEAQPFARHMQEEMVREIQSGGPEFVVLVTTPVSWFVRPDSYEILLNWWNQSYRTNFFLVGTAQVISPVETRYSWGPDVNSHIESSSSLLVYQRKKPSPDGPKSTEAVP